MKLSELHLGEKGFISKVNGKGAFRRRILEMGFVEGKLVEALVDAPLHDPIKYRIMNYEVSLRSSEADLIEIIPFHEVENGEYKDEEYFETIDDLTLSSNSFNVKESESRSIDKKEIKIALVGNPNAGKTSIFNAASGGHERVGNYGGVTVDSKEGKVKYKDYLIRIVDLPGTYSLSANSPEELFVRRHILEEKPDVVVNVVGASAIERNLFLTTELLDLETDMVIALNMYDELEKSGSVLNIDLLSHILETPIIPTVGKSGEGITDMFDSVIKIYERRHIRKSPKEKRLLNFGRVINLSLDKIQAKMELFGLTPKDIPPRYVAIRLLEGDKEVIAEIKKHDKGDELIDYCKSKIEYVEKLQRTDVETAFANIRYGFINKLLSETLSQKSTISVITQKIDALVTNNYLGFPLFFFFMWLMFECTFILGEYPKAGIESLVQMLSSFVSDSFSDGPLKDLIADGIIGGVGEVIVFLPNIVILYTFISFMEDSGYMARAAFIMDKVMRKIGLHGKSFIPLIMGFGCNVPAIMSTRTIESRSSRMITILVNPFMSCSARLPVYILFAGVFFPGHQGLMLFGLYMLGILLAVICALIFKRFLFNKEDLPFVMELPPYRIPTVKAVITHMWDKAQQYLKKMGGIILIASVIIWFLGYFPINGEMQESYDQQVEEVENLFAEKQIDEEVKDSLTLSIEHHRQMEHQANSYIGRIGHTIEPVMRPLGFDWKISVALLSGMAAKEIVVSTLAVLYTGEEDGEDMLKDRLLSEVKEDGTPLFNQINVLSLLVFVLVYFPCVAVVAAIKKESGAWKWSIFSIVYTTGLAWILSFAIYQIGTAFF